MKSIVLRKCFFGSLALLALGGCGTGAVDPNAPIASGPYVAQEGDNLSMIAVRAYGDMSVWYALLNANPQLSKRPGFDLEPGETIIVPAKDDLDMTIPESTFPEQLPAEYIVMPANSLHMIAEGVYGDENLWPLIYEANRDQLSSRVKEDTRRLIAGQVLHLPAKADETGAQESEQKEAEGAE